jgi:hypothetical protein
MVCRTMYNRCFTNARSCLVHQAITTSSQQMTEGHDWRGIYTSHKRKIMKIQSFLIRVSRFICETGALIGTQRTPNPS